MGPVSAAAALGLLFFAATDYPHGRELWVSNGTAQGTRMVRNLSPGREDTQINSIVPVSGGVAFIAALSTGSRNLYFSDGTPGGTEILNTNPGDFISPGGSRHYYFAPATNAELWYTDGTTGGTRPILGLQNQIQGGTSVVLPFGSRTLIVAVPMGWDGENIVAYLHDPVRNRLAKVPIPFNPYGASAGVAVVGDKFVYVHETARYGLELWVSDGTRAGTKLLRDIIRGPIGGLDPAWAGHPHGPFTFRGKAYFTANDNVHGPELWVTDGTAAGTRMLADFVPGPDASIQFTNNNFAPSSTRVLSIGSRALIASYTRKRQLWTSDGSPSGTKHLNLRNANGMSVTAVDLQYLVGAESNFVFEGFEGVAYNPRSSESALYAGTVNGDTRLIRNINTVRCQSTQDLGDPDFISGNVQRGSLNFFAANAKTTDDTPNDGICVGSGASPLVYNIELFVTDGTRDGTRMVKEIYPGISGLIGQQLRPIGSNPTNLTLGGAPN